ncbi:MAG: hypothetical protein RBU45_18525 [Myxococcota bacterium]|jgi:hypothetical protein|nr:hypothetical protein [Myxococcota bacterium]
MSRAPLPHLPAPTAADRRAEQARQQAELLIPPAAARHHAGRVLLLHPRPGEPLAPLAGLVLQVGGLDDAGTAELAGELQELLDLPVEVRREEVPAGAEAAAGDDATGWLLYDPLPSRPTGSRSDDAARP